MYITINPAVPEEPAPLHPGMENTVNPAAPDEPNPLSPRMYTTVNPASPSVRALTSGEGCFACRTFSETIS